MMGPDFTAGLVRQAAVRFGLILAALMIVIIIAATSGHHEPAPVKLVIPAVSEPTTFIGNNTHTGVATFTNPPTSCCSSGICAKEGHHVQH